MKYILPFFLCLSSIGSVHSQGIDTLDTLLLNAYKSNDSSEYYFSKSKKLLKNKADTANYWYFRFFRNDVLRITDSTAYYSNKVIPLLKSLDSLERIRKIYERLYYQELRTGKYEEALGFTQQALTIAEKMKDTGLVSRHTSDISIVYHDFEDYEKGVSYGKKAYKIMDEAKNKNYKYLIFANNATAINFDDWGKADSALFYHYRNVELLKKVDDSLNFTFIFNNIGNTLLKTKRYTEAKKYINRSLVMNTLKGNIYNLATNYTNLATIAYEQGKNTEAKENFILANKFAQESGSIEKIRDVVQQEAWFYKKIGDYKNALEKQEAFYKLRDSVFNDERAAKVTEMETKYETEKKERDLAETRANLAETELEVERKNKFIYGSMAFGLILGLLGYLFYNQQKLKNNQLRREGELKEALAKIETQNKLQEQRLRISRDLHDNIGAQLTFVTSSVDNLKYGLQDKDDKVSDKLTRISAFTTQTIYELRDTIWAMNKENISVEDLQARISNFIDKAGVADSKVKFTFQVAESISKELMLPSIKGMNVYRIIQEGVNNALKYADAKTIIVSILEKDNQLVLSILDDGKGFDLKNTEMGNGLNNIKKRARDLNGRVHINSDNKGTIITLTFPMD
ncbi:sensor histidine kinase [Aureisphaera sp. CAU 1614]|uniref:histidine kinase n=1 Tax=Halomarinibacterium sedimenti TaxID=2857106 RepID=A0A9X1JUK8_9FLAO|nr:sensor histidine kinase [Halomarinibacterium sedimenti]MBW2936740.1 sensor histidine kinase [Halomarinibacterium sedimenti]